VVPSTLGEYGAKIKGHTCAKQKTHNPSSLSVFSSFSIENLNTQDRLSILHLYKHPLHNPHPISNHTFDSTKNLTSFVFIGFPIPCLYYIEKRKWCAIIQNVNHSLGWVNEIFWGSLDLLRLGRVTSYEERHWLLEKLSDGAIGNV